MATVVVAALSFVVSLNERKRGGGIVGLDRREIEEDKKIKHWRGYKLLC